jgi:cation:H+ antiporter
VDPLALDLARLLGGGVLLYFGAEWLVGGSAQLARSFGISALLVGLTVVAYGTSTPEIVVGVQAAAAGHRDIALGNVLGSNIANLGLILGATALLSPAKVVRPIPRREVPVLVGSALLVPLVLLDGAIHAWEAGVLLAIAIGYTVWMVRTSRVTAQGAAEAAEVTAEAADAVGAPAMGTAGRAWLAAIALAGLATLVLGGDLFVDGATGIALRVGMSERLVGLTIVAVGTSLPELATSLVAGYRGHSDIAVGNVIGSNVFNVLTCLSVASLAGEVGAPLADVSRDVLAMVGLTILAAVFMRTERAITRAEGALLVACYVGFLVLVTAGG